MHFQFNVRQPIIHLNAKLDRLCCEWFLLRKACCSVKCLTHTHADTPSAFIHQNRSWWTQIKTSKNTVVQETTRNTKTANC